MVTYESLQRIENDLLRVLQLTSQLHGIENGKRIREINDSLYNTMRKIVIANELSERSIICVSGLQGAGKTTLLKNFYSIDDGNMNIVLGRGEKIPILITEKKDCTIPSAKKISLITKNGIVTREVNNLSPDEFVAASSANEPNSTTMYLELYVPMKHTFNEKVSFMLLPGYEKKNDYWKTLIDFSVNCSGAAIFVFNESSFSSKDNDDLCNKISKQFGTNVIYAISHSDESSDDNKEVKQTCMEAMSIPKDESDRIICCGEYNNDKIKQKCWIDQLKNSIDKYTASIETANKNSKTYIYDLIENDIRPMLFEIEDEMGSDDGNQIFTKLENSSYLNGFDNEKNKLRKKLSVELDNELEKSKDIAIDNLQKLMSNSKTAKEHGVNTSALSKIRRFFFGSNVKDIINAKEIVREALKDSNSTYSYQTSFCKAIDNSLHSLTTNNNTKGLITYTKPETSVFDDLDSDPSSIIVPQGINENCETILHDACTLLQAQNTHNDIVELKHNNIGETLQVVVELGTAYCGINAASQILAENKGFNFFLSELKSNDVKKGMDKTTKFAFGVLGITGIDLAGDGVINAIPALASSLGVAVAPVAVAVGAIMAFGASTVIMKDINRMQTADFYSACNSITSAILSVKTKYLNAYDDYMLCIRDAIEKNLIDVSGVNKNSVIKFNLKSLLNQLNNDFSEIGQEIRENRYEIKKSFS